MPGVKRSNVAFLTDQKPPFYKLPDGDYEYFAANDRPDTCVMVRERQPDKCREVVCMVKELLDG